MRDRPWICYLLILSCLSTAQFHLRTFSTRLRTVSLLPEAQMTGPNLRPKISRQSQRLIIRRGLLTFRTVYNDTSTLSITRACVLPTGVVPQNNYLLPLLSVHWRSTPRRETLPSSSRHRIPTPPLALPFPHLRLCIRPLCAGH
ncbi:hypothetical protein DEU56DRAFT_162276 [Suillus clintonianus]|uniref:uncharacterized protein n=1 Tax=Suillus clintonianus TaxID=1904413 RepID=UPI001B87E3A5|nr:uncharacterized protein DEU56DRAFT_162276 [Suillus clintonianus]KAG2116942.1 hypothetical protein DEU56DRAFT_162276 [Suillus clintonianus]